MVVFILLTNCNHFLLQNGQTPLQIAQKLGYISVIETLKVVTNPGIQSNVIEEKYRVVAPEAMHETFMSDSEEEGGRFFNLNIFLFLKIDSDFLYNFRSLKSDMKLTNLSIVNPVDIKKFR